MSMLRVQVLICCLLLTACDSGPGKASQSEPDDEATAAIAEQATVPAVFRKNADLAACLAEESAEPDPAIAPCPTYVLQSLDYMLTECQGVGGVLQPMEEAGVWSLDVDADSRPEVFVDLTQSFTCYGDPAVFSCGSLGCPYFIYSQRGDAWVELGAVNADDAPGIEALPTKTGTPATLRGGCLGARPCSEMTYYKWKGNAYDRSWLEYRGHLVDVVPSNLLTLTKDASVLTAPSKNGQEIDQYPAGTTVVVIGAARSAPYKYVSPCTGCRRGFVEAAALE
ncbi:MAG: hypothetical protein HW417_216 [Steroidobacteraceae bacterium]|nr:hypothetical protein [Steroidobacteraceae bacterium]MBM2853288.1 hypothetical protein [Steroidobacteraceae bacterium]